MANELMTTGDAATRIREEVSGAHSREYIMQLLKNAARDGRIEGDAKRSKALVNYASALKWYKDFLKRRQNPDAQLEHWK